MGTSRISLYAHGNQRRHHLPQWLKEWSLHFSFEQDESPSECHFHQNRITTTSTLSKRATRYGPLVPQIEGLLCLGEVDVGEVPPCPACSGGGVDETLQKRDGKACLIDSYGSKEERCSDEASSLERRRGKDLTVWYDHTGVKRNLPYPDYPQCSKAGGSVIRWFGYPPEKPHECNVVLGKYSQKDIDPSDFVSKSAS